MFLIASSKRFLLFLMLPLVALAAVSPVSAAALAPAGAQYKYDPVPTASGDPAATAGPAATSASGTSIGFPLVLAGMITLVVGVSGAWMIFGARRRRGGGSSASPAPLVAVLGAIVVGVFALGASGTTAAPSPKAPKGFLGMAPQEGFSSDEAARMKKGGVGAIRVPISWAQVQPVSAERFEWGLTDAGIRAAAENGIPVLPVLYATPAWVAPSTTTLPRTSAEIAAWTGFVAAAVQRYGTNGSFWNEPEQEGIPKTPPRSWQLWNEANFRYFASPVSASAYGRLVAAASPVIRSNDPRAQVMLSGLFGRPSGPPSKAVSAPVFLKQLSQTLRPSAFDSIALHPYSPNTAELKKLVIDFRRSADRFGYRKKPIHVTEIGWGSGPARNRFLKGSERAQAGQLTSALGFLVGSRSRYRIASAYWYAWKDTPPGVPACNFCSSVGLFKWGQDLKPKQAWNSFVKLSGGRAR